VGKPRYFKIILILVISIFVGTFYLWRIINPFIPTYSEVNNQLLIGNTRFVSQEEEFYLEPLSEGKKIGKIKGGGWVFEIQGQDPKDWILRRGFMSLDLVYRNSKLPPVDYRKLNFTQLQIISTQGRKVIKTINNKALIDKFLKSTK